MVYTAEKSISYRIGCGYNTIPSFNGQDSGFIIFLHILMPSIRIYSKRKTGSKYKIGF